MGKGGKERKGKERKGKETSVVEELEPWTRRIVRAERSGNETAGQKIREE